MYEWFFLLFFEVKRILKWHSASMKNGSAHETKRAIRCKQRKTSLPSKNTSPITRIRPLAARPLVSTFIELWRTSSGISSTKCRKLHDGDFANRLQFAHDELSRMDENLSHLSLLTFSDEAHFHLDNVLNSHNYRYGAPQKPGWQKLLRSPWTTARVAIGEDDVDCPFSNENVNSERYLPMLRDEFWPALQRNGKEDLLFMQDRVPPHWGSQVKNSLKNHFPQCRMGCVSPNMHRGASAAELIRTYDFMPWDFFMRIRHSKNRRITTNGHSGLEAENWSLF